jgi:hypothetical protein
VWAIDIGALRWFSQPIRELVCDLGCSYLRHFYGPSNSHFSVTCILFADNDLCTER